MRTGLRVNVAGALCLTALIWMSLSDSPVADAAMNGDVEAVRTLLRQGADVNTAQGDGMSALHWAAESGLVEMTDMLIYAGADLEAVTRIGDQTPLHVASRAGMASTVEALLKAGADANATTATGGATSMHLAAASGSADAISLLIGSGADVDALDSARGQSALMFAAAFNRVAAIHALIDGGADHTLASRVESMPDRQQADRVAGQRRNQVLQAFRAAQGPDQAGGPTTGQVQTAIQAALAENTVPNEPGDEEEVDTEEARPQPLSYAELVGGQGGLTALLYGSREGNSHAVAALLDAGADINRVSLGDHTSPMLIAVLNGHFDLAIDLFERGADASLASDAGSTPLYAVLNAHWAPKARYPQQQAYQQQRLNYLDVMKVLLESGVAPNVRLNKHLWYMSYTFDLLGVNTTGATPFWRAAYGLDVAAMELLMAHGADPGMTTQTVPSRRRRNADQLDMSDLPPVPMGGLAVHPIHAATGVGYGEDFAGNSHRHVPEGWMPSLRYLVEVQGADVNARDHNGYSPVHHAAARGDTEMIRYLGEHGADVTLVSRKGQTTADMANGPVQRIQPFPEALQLLESLGAVNNHNCLSC
jgi:ankyrin repeat protein